MSESIPFLRPRLIGRRYSGAAIPLEVLKDLAALEEMIVEVAKWRFLEDNPSRKRSPRGFTESASLKLTAVEDGSAIPVISLFLASASTYLFPPQNQAYLEEARDRVLRAVEAAQHDAPITPHLPEALLGYFDRVGRSLREGEAIELNPENRANPSRLDRTSRRKLLLAAAHVQELTEEVHLRGLVPEADQQRDTFTLQVLGGPRLTAPIETQHAAEVIAAFNGYKAGAKVLVQGVGIFNRAGKLQKILDVEHVSLLDPNDVLSRLAELRELQPGWLEGGGEALPDDGIHWLGERFETLFPDHLPLPYLYPTPDGGVQAEWSLPPAEISMEISLNDRTAEWHVLDLETNQSEEALLRLDEQEAWAFIVEKLDLLSRGARG